MFSLSTIPDFFTFTVVFETFFGTDLDSPLTLLAADLPGIFCNNKEILVKVILDINIGVQQFLPIRGKVQLIQNEVFKGFF